MAGFIVDFKNAQIDMIISDLRAAAIYSNDAWQQLTDLGVNDLAAERLIDDVMMEVV
tara:strand:+ start:330 stop:500 length:171 start_codon:yes stop_codon:yes gene_type:complete